MSATKELQFFKPFGRLGKWRVVKAKMDEAAGCGALIKQDQNARTVEASIGDQFLFRAMEKSEGVWLILYSEKYYQK